MTGCDTAQDQIIAYATGGLAANEVRDLLDHLATCPACSRLLHEVVDAVHLLPYGLPPVQPPESLRTRILEAIRLEEERQSTPGEEASRDRPEVRRNVPRWTTAALAVGWLLFVVAAGGWWHHAAQIREVREELREQREQWEAAATVLGEEVVQPIISLAMERGSEDFPRAWGHATVYDTRYGYVTILALGGLPDPGPGAQYRVWLYTRADAVDGGTFRPDAEGYATVVLRRKDIPFREVAVVLESQQEGTRFSGEREGKRVLRGTFSTGRASWPRLLTSTGAKPRPSVHPASRD